MKMREALWSAAAKLPLLLLALEVFLQDLSLTLQLQSGSFAAAVHL